MDAYPPYPQKGVDGGSKWKAGTRETAVRLGGWCEGGLGQQSNDGGGCAAMREMSERVEIPGTYVTFHAAIFAWTCVLSDRSPVLWWLSL